MRKNELFKVIKCLVVRGGGSGVGNRLVKRAKKGDKEALLQLILLHQDDYYRLAWSYMKNKNDALDVMEDMIVKLYENIHTLKKLDSFSSWSKKILINCCYTMYNKRKKTVLLEREYLEKVADTKQEASYEEKDSQIDIDRLLASLSSPQADAIRLKYIHDLDLETIAEIEDVSVGTVKSRIFYGLKKLNHMYRGERDE